MPTYQKFKIAATPAEKCFASLNSVLADRQLLSFKIILGAVGSLVVRASDCRPEGLGSMPDVTKYPPSTHGFTCRNCGGGDRGRVAIYRPFGEFRRAESHCHLYGAQRQAYLLPMPR
ncbi:hypothetical protein TNCV_3680061 [Trichonephila clavipes]|nr:hypothetical protein TNCV_3680061 [Trichonephila clavipes]